MKNITHNTDSGTRTFLIEFSVAVLTFVLCSVLCLGAFASSYWLSSGTAKLDQAVLLAEEKAETLKVSHEPAANLSETFAETGLRITVTPAETKTGLASARIQVFDAETGRRIHEITAAWQIAIMEEGES